MISYHGTTTYSGLGTARSVTRSYTGTGNPPAAYSYTRAETEVGTTFTPGGAYTNSSGSASRVGTEIADNGSGGTSTIGVGYSDTYNDTGSSRSYTTFRYDNTDGNDTLVSYTSATSTTLQATSRSLLTSTTTTANTTRTGTVTSTTTTASHTISLSSTTTSLATATLTATSATSTTTTSLATTTSASAIWAASQNLYTIWRADTHEVIAIGAATSTAYTHGAPESTTGRPLTTLTATATSLWSQVPSATSTTTYSWVAPYSTHTDYTITSVTRASNSATLTVLSSVSTTATIANSADPAGSTTTSLALWSTTTTTAREASRITGTTSATYSGWSQWTYTHPYSISSLITRTLWGHSVGSTVTTWAAHGLLETVTFTTRALAATTTTTGTFTTARFTGYSVTTTSTAVATAARFNEEFTLASTFAFAGETAVGATYTIADWPGRVSQLHTAGQRYAAFALEPLFLPARQVTSAYAATDARYLDVSTSYDGISTTGSAHGGPVTVHYATNGDAFSATGGGAQSAASVGTSAFASDSEATGTIGTAGTLINYSHTTSGAPAFSTQGLGGFENKRPSFSDLACTPRGLWRGTTQEGTSSGTTTYAESDFLTGSSGRQTALEPMASVALNRNLASVFGSFNTLTAAQ